MPSFDANIVTSLDSVTHVIQTALTPVFLLTGLATLLNVFSTRLARVAGRGEQAIKALETAQDADVEVLRKQLLSLRRRAVALDMAVILAAGAGAATCSTILLLFVKAVGGDWVSRALFSVFGVAILFALGAILSYAAEMLIAGTGIRGELAHGKRRRFMRHRDDT